MTDVTSLVNLGDLVNRHADSDAMALIDCLDEEAPRTYSHGALDHAANAVARALVVRGDQRGDRMAIIAANRAEYLLAYFGAMRAGMVSVPVNFKLPRDTVDYVLRDAGVSMIFTDAERRNLCPADLPVVEFGSTAADGFEAAPPRPDLWPLDRIPTAALHRR